MNFSWPGTLYINTLGKCSFKFFNIYFFGYYINILKSVYFRLWGIDFLNLKNISIDRLYYNTQDVLFFGLRTMRSDDSMNDLFIPIQSPDVALNDIYLIHDQFR